ncbi:hypothetical protein [Vogesella sp. LIG4]|uniref:hypothetical protein n=1 Tax=Vogesella sp. LIG4 TaxID=1192162 RepID=UPI0012FDC353|nr:hypothetical protein [Vogesella sp. LIG4]
MGNLNGSNDKYSARWLAFTSVARLHRASPDKHQCSLRRPDNSAGKAGSPYRYASAGLRPRCKRLAVAANLPSPNPMRANSFISDNINFIKIEKPIFGCIATNGKKPLSFMAKVAMGNLLA